MPLRQSRVNQVRARLPATHDTPLPDAAQETAMTQAGPSRLIRRGPSPTKPSIYTIPQNRLDTLLRRAEKERLVQHNALDDLGAAERTPAGRRVNGSRRLTKAERAHATTEGLKSADRLREMNFQAHWEVDKTEGMISGLPDSDLLRAIHHRAAEFYHDQGLMYPKIKRSNERGWYTLRKRRMLSEQGGLAEPVPDEEELPPTFDLRRNTRAAAGKRIDPALPASATQGGRGVKRKAEVIGPVQRSPSKGISPRKEVEVVIPLPRGWSRVPRGSTATPHEDNADSARRTANGAKRARRTERRAASTDEDELDTDGESEYQGGETDSEDSAPAEEDPDDPEDPDNPDDPDDAEWIEQEHRREAAEGVTHPKRKYKSKQREMHRALDGSALLAIGILVEEHILEQLHQAGYRSERAALERAEEGETQGVRFEDDLSDEEEL